MMIKVDPNCTLCPLHETRTLVVQPSLPKGVTPRILFLGRDPGAEEDIVGSPLIGRSGQLLRGIVRDVGIPEEWCAWDNVVHCHTPKNRGPKNIEVSNCQLWVESIVNELRPEIIVTLGQEALEAYVRPYGFKPTKPMFKLEDVHGAILGTLWVFPTYHPSAGLRNTAYRRLLISDMRKLAALLGVSHTEPCERVVDGIPYIPINRCGLDFEWDTTTGEILGYSISWIEEDKVVGKWMPGDTGQKLLHILDDWGCTFILHNAKADFQTMLREWGWTPEKYEDTYIAYALKHNAELTESEKGSLGLKELALKYLGMSWPGMDELGPVQDMSDDEAERYCCNDAAAALLLWEKIEGDINEDLPINE